jgi:hypothetical protein
VPGAATFAEILEAELNCTNVLPAAGHASAAWHRPLTAPLFVFDRRREARHLDDVDVRGCAPPLDPLTRHAGPQPNPPTRERATPLTKSPIAPTVALSAREQRSLTALIDLGADLGDSLSLRTLRQAFRRLAHRYHPDRHPQCSAAERNRLARAFAEVTEHYRVLAAALAH